MNVKRLLVALALVLAAMAALLVFERGDPLEKEYAWLWAYPKTITYPDGMKSYGNYPEGGFGPFFAALPYDSVTLERADGEKGGYRYTITVRRDGSASLDALASQAGRGRFDGHVWPKDYARLCYLLEKLDVKAFDASYDGRTTHSRMVALSLYGSGAEEPQRITDRGDFGPIELWAIQMCIEGLSSRARWRQTQDR